VTEDDFDWNAFAAELEALAGAARRDPEKPSAVDIAAVDAQLAALDLANAVAHRN
jgi:hypothetical protein